MSSHFFIVGKKGFGVLFIRTAPLRVASVSHETIAAYEASHPGVDGYARVAAAAKSMLVRQNGQPEAEFLRYRRFDESTISAGVRFRFGS